MIKAYSKYSSTTVNTSTQNREVDDSAFQKLQCSVSSMREDLIPSIVQTQEFLIAW